MNNLYFKLGLCIWEERLAGILFIKGAGILEASVAILQTGGDTNKPYLAIATCLPSNNGERARQPR